MDADRRASIDSRLVFGKNGEATFDNDSPAPNFGNDSGGRTPPRRVVPHVPALPSYNSAPTIGNVSAAGTLSRSTSSQVSSSQSSMPNSYGASDLSREVPPCTALLGLPALGARRGSAATPSCYAASRACPGAASPRGVSPRRASERDPLLPGSHLARAKVHAEREVRAGRITTTVLSALLWYGIGVAYLMRIEHWDGLSASYFVLQIVTTIGYGDHPDYIDEYTKIYVSFYTLICILLVAFAVSQNLGGAVMRSAQRALVGSLRKNSSGSGEAAQDEEERWKDLVNSFFLATAVSILGTAFYANFEACSCRSSWHTRIEGCVTGDLCKETGGQLMQWSDSFYMSIMTMTTVGFGDAHPTTTRGQEFSIIFMIIGVLSISNFIRAFVMYFMANSLRKPLTLDKKIDRQLFAEIDSDGSGLLSRDKFVRYILLRHQLISMDILDEIDQQFDALAPQGDTYVTYACVEQRYRELQQAPAAFGPWQAFFDRAWAGGGVRGASQF